MAQAYLHNCTFVKSILEHSCNATGDERIGNYQWHMDAERESVRAFIEKAAAAADTDYTGLARKAGLAASTITRFMNGDTSHILSTRTLGKISRVAGVPLPGGGGEVMSDNLRLTVLAAVARALGVELSEATLTDRQREWMAVIDRLPISLDRQALDMLRGIADAASLHQNEGGPGETSRRRIKG